MQPSEGRSALLEREVSELYHEHAAGLRQYALTLDPRPEAARDAVQEAFLRYFVARSYGRQIENPRAWLLQVVRNYQFDQKACAASKYEVGAVEIDRMVGNAKDPEALVRRSETAREIISTLSDQEMDCLRLQISGHCYEEIADALNLRPGTVGAVMSRVHRKLREASEKGEIQLEEVEAVRLLHP